MSEEAILQEAINKQSDSQRISFLESACADDPEMMQRLLVKLSMFQEGQMSNAQRMTPGETVKMPTGGIPNGAKPTHQRPVIKPTDELQPGSILAKKYKIIKKIGQGGMGKVYAAEQVEPIHRMVALKVTRGGVDMSYDTFARFEQERQALAVMKHPNIASIHDAGLTDDGRPFFAMEYVEGEAVTKYCDEQKLSLRERIELFIPVCQAVQHAHQKGIIHRDLKPGNILVTMEQGKALPKVIDFGVSKALSNNFTNLPLETGLGTIVGTLEYMAPEQAKFSVHDIDTRADIYSLGMILYELLTGEPPFDRLQFQLAPFDEVIRLIHKEEPIRPSTKVSKSANAEQVAATRKVDVARLRWMLKGDLDWVVLKCLEKDREKRYESANDLAGDLQKHLEDRPVTACPPSMSYRVKKYVQRHKAGVIAGSIVLLALVGSIVGISVALYRAVKAERLAREEVELQKELTAFIEKYVIGGIDPDERAGMGLPTNSDVRARDLLEQAARQLDQGLFSGKPKTEAALRLTVGKAFISLAMGEEGLKHTKRADELRREHYGPEHPDRLESARHYAEAIGLAGDGAGAEAMYRFVWEKRKKVLGEDDEQTLKTLRDLILLKQGGKNADETEELHKELLRLLLRKYGENNKEVAKARITTGDFSFEKGQFEEAEKAYRNAWTHCREVLGEDHSYTLGVLNKYATVLNKRKQHHEAERLFLELVTRAERVYGSHHAIVGVYMHSFAHLYFDSDQYEKAEAWFRKSLEKLEKSIPTHDITCQTKRGLAYTLMLMQRVDESLVLFRDVLPKIEKRVGPTHPDVFFVRSEIVLGQIRKGRIAEALRDGKVLFGLLNGNSPLNETAWIDHMEEIVKELLQRKHVKEASELVQEELARVSDEPTRARLRQVLGEKKLLP